MSKKNSNLRSTTFPLVYFKNESQRRFVELYDSHDIILCQGPAGTAKTWCAVYCAVKDVIDGECRRDKILFTRPIVEAAGEELGFLPGDTKEKIAPYLVPLYNNFSQIMPLNEKDPDYTKLRASVIAAYTAMPVSQMRGLTFYNTVCIMDEAQNATKPILELFLTRMGQGSKMILVGDTDQTDVDRSYFLRMFYLFRDSPSVGLFSFDLGDIVRHEMVGRIVEIMRNDG